MVKKTEIKYLNIRTLSAHTLPGERKQRYIFTICIPSGKRFCLQNPSFKSNAWWLDTKNKNKIYTV